MQRCEHDFCNNRIVKLYFDILRECKKVNLIICFSVLDYL